MARKVSSEQPPPPIKLLKSVDEVRAKIADRIEKGRVILTKEIVSKEVFEESQNEYYKWSSYNTELLNQLFSNDTLASEYSFSFGSRSTSYSLALQIEDLRNEIKEKIHILDSISERLDVIPVAENVSSTKLTNFVVSQNTSKVFLVHGHEEAIRESTARFLSRLRLDPIILHEQPSGGKTIIEKLEEFSNVGFAVVLLTPDDEGRMRDKDLPLQPRARQNVLLELGFFTGRLGRHKVCALHRGNIEIPTDYIGVLYIPFDEGGGWQLKLAKELKKAGFSIDMNNVVES